MTTTRDRSGLPGHGDGPADGADVRPALVPRQTRPAAAAPSGERPLPATADDGDRDAPRAGERVGTRVGGAQPPRSRTGADRWRGPVPDAAPAPDAAPRRSSAERLGAALVAVLVVAGVAALLLAALLPLPAGPGLASAAPGAPAAHLADGSAGLLPGGPTALVTVPLANPTGRVLVLTALVAHGDAFPSSCPALLWHLVPDRAATLAPGAAARLPVLVTLAAQAPSSCQGLTIEAPVTVTAALPAGGSVELEATVPLHVAALGAPQARVRDDGGSPAVSGSPAADGPDPRAYTVDAVLPGGRRVPVCRSYSVLECVDTTAGAAVERTYVVTGWFGSWHAEAAPIRIWTLPPAPDVRLPGGPLVHLRTAAADGDYELSVSVDEQPAVRLTVRAGADLDGDVPLGDLADGRHVVRVTASAHGRDQVASAAFTSVGGTPVPR